ncbi:MAG: cytidine deaminase [Bacteroidia bacterium]|nr:cytidine deaminase [Bacteroidia bacterium]
MKKTEFSTVVYEYDSLDELSKEEVFLVEKAKESAMNAYAPYSKFQVGVSVLLSNNKVVNGNNQENAAYPSGLCAERVAIFYANAKYPDVAVKAIAICAFTNTEFVKTPIPPCGGCRQSLLETEMRYHTPIKVILAGSEKIFIINSVKDLLPLNFNSDML